VHLGLSSIGVSTSDLGPDRCAGLLVSPVHQNRRCSGLFAMLDDATRDNIINTMEHAQYSTAAVVLKQGDKDAEQFFVVESGRCEVYLQHKNGAATPQAKHGSKLEVCTACSLPPSFLLPAVHHQQARRRRACVLPESQAVLPAGCCCGC